MSFVPVRCVIKIRTSEEDWKEIDEYTMVLFGDETNQAVQAMNFRKSWLDENMMFVFEKIDEPPQLEK